ncbi:MAG: ATP-dependent protease, partial [Opitutales bacterium]
PQAYLKELKDQNSHLQRDVLISDIKHFAADFERTHKFTLEFKPLAIDALILESVEEDRTIQSLCEEKFRDFEHGLNIINRNTGQTVFKIGKLTIKDPDKELSKWVVRSIETVKENGNG